MLYTLNVAMAFAFLSSLYGDFMQVCQHSKNISFQVMLACLNYDALFLFSTSKKLPAGASNWK